jgi:hypothetical protein
VAAEVVPPFNSFAASGTYATATAATPPDFKLVPTADLLAMPQRLDRGNGCVMLAMICLVSEFNSDRDRAGSVKD